MNNKHDVGDSNVSNEFLDFLLDKAYQSYIEAEKHAGQALLICLLLLSLDALLIFGKDEGNKDFTVPLLQLSLNRQYASIVILILFCSASFWYYISLKHSRRLMNKILGLIIERYNTQLEDWTYITSPSFRDIFRRHSVPACNTKSGRDFERIIKRIVVNLFMIATYLLPFVFLWFICTNLQWPIFVRVAAFIILVILLLPSVLIPLSPDI